MDKRARMKKSIMAEARALLFMAPYLLLFTAFIVVPVCIAIVMSFTDFNALEFPRFVGLKNYIDILTQDTVFLRNVLPNTFIFAVIVGPVGFFLGFILAWAPLPLYPAPMPCIVCCVAVSCAIKSWIAGNRHP